MKRTILQKAAAAALFVLLTAALLAAADFLLVDDVHSYSRVMLQELYADAGNIDTLFLGSSHCYRSVDPAQVDAALGTHSFNAGSSQQLPDGSYYMLKEAVAQNPLKTVYLEMFYTGYNESASVNIPLACYLLADHMDWRSPNRYAYLSEMGGLAAYADLLLPARHGIAPPSSMPALWKAKLTDGYTPDSYGYVTYTDSGEAYRGRGFVYTTGIPQDGFATLLNVDADAPLSDFGWEYLNKITDFCAENGIRLVLFTAPLPSGYLYNTENYQSYVDALRNFCAAHDGLEYWDFSLYKLQSEINLKIEDFSDAHHLNGFGMPARRRAAGSCCWGQTYYFTRCSARQHCRCWRAAAFWFGGAGGAPRKSPCSLRGLRRHCCRWPCSSICPLRWAGRARWRTLWASAILRCSSSAICVTCAGAGFCLRKNTPAFCAMRRSFSPSRRAPSTAMTP